jgi:ribosomal RNA-processing protein 12
MIIEESDSDAVGVAEPDVAGTAYQEALTSVDGFTRGPGGRIKFNKDTKKRRRENAVEDGDVEMAETEPARTTGEKKSGVKLGHEFKAKVWIRLPSFLRQNTDFHGLSLTQKAGGDLKKGGLDPYAYVSLKQAAKKANRRTRLGVAGKR